MTILPPGPRPQIEARAHLVKNGRYPQATIWLDIIVDGHKDSLPLSVEETSMLKRSLTLALRALADPEEEER